MAKCKCSRTWLGTESTAEKIDEGRKIYPCVEEPSGVRMTLHKRLNIRKMIREKGFNIMWRRRISTLSSAGPTYHSCIRGKMHVHTYYTKTGAVSPLTQHNANPFHSPELRNRVTWLSPAWAGNGPRHRPIAPALLAPCFSSLLATLVGPAPPAVSGNSRKMNWVVADLEIGGGLRVWEEKHRSGPVSDELFYVWMRKFFHVQPSSKLSYCTSSSFN